MKHKHAELIKAWADGAIIEARYHKATGWTDWQEEIGGFIWYQSGAEYRIKPEPKPDFVRILNQLRPVESKANLWEESDYQVTNNRIKITFDGETGKLKNAEVLT